MQSIEELRAALRGTALELREMVAMPILDTGEVAFAVQISAAEVESMWRVARSAMPLTGRWPVATIFAGLGRTWRENAMADGHFSRFYYLEAPGAIDVSPRALLRAADAIDVEALIAELGKNAKTYDSLDEALECEIDATESACGMRPSEQEISEASLEGRPLSTPREVDRWLMNWESQRDVPTDRAVGRQSWFEDEPMALLFLPVTEPWDALAYMNWFGTSDPGAEYYIALGRSWYARYGAELVSHYGTMLQCLVTRPPTTLEEAYQLACEHELAAPTGFGLRHYAFGLVGHDRWFLHNRP
jgi:hypothetical protein